MTLSVAVALFCRFGIHGAQSRDESIYSYAGQQLARGVLPYASIFDPKGPVAAFVAGAAAWLAGAAGVSDLYAIRLAFMGFSLLSVLAMYLLASRLFCSRLAGLTAGIVLAASPAFAMDALGGPDAKTPGVFFVVTSMLMMVERRWFWAALAASLGMLTWQPYFVYAVVAGLLALCLPQRGERWRSFAQAILGGALPVLATFITFAAAGQLSFLAEATLAFPLTGVNRADVTLAEQASHVAGVATEYGGGWLFWLGLVLLVGIIAYDIVRHRSSWRRAAARPLVCVVLLTGLGEFGYAMLDFQGYPDLYPLLPYVAMGFGGFAGLLVTRSRGARRSRRIGVVVLVAVSLGVLVAVRWTEFGHDPSNGELVAQRADACGLRRIVVPGTPLYSLGDPTPLVLTGRTNPDRFIFLAAGVAQWKIDHTPGGMDGWTSEIAAANPSVVVFRGFSGQSYHALDAWLRSSGYRKAFLGQWPVFVTDEAVARAGDQDVLLTPRPTAVAKGRHGHTLPSLNCHLKRG